MIQDRLTAKFRSAKLPKRREAKAVTPKTAHKTKGPVTDTFTKGRQVAGSFWL